METWMIALIAVLAAVVLAALVYLLVLVRPRARRPQNGALLCDYAHRGLHGGEVPENSLQAFELACRAGHGIELDVQLSRDGVVMVFHDATLARMTGCDRKLCELTAAELGALRLGDTDEHIPTFAEVLALVDGRVPLLVELKGETTDTALCPRVAELLRSYKGAYCIESFNPMLIRAIKKHLPHAFCGLLYTNVCRDKQRRSALNIALTCMALNVLAYPDFIAYNVLDRDSVVVKLTTKLYRAPRFVWTLRSKEERQKASELGECAIFEQ